MRPTDAGPAHERRDGYAPLVRPARPVDTGPAWPTRNADVPLARSGVAQAGWPAAQPDDAMRVHGDRRPVSGAGAGWPAAPDPAPARSAWSVGAPQAPTARPVDARTGWQGSHAQDLAAHPVGNPQVPTARPEDHARTGRQGANAQDPTARPVNNPQLPTARPGDHTQTGRQDAGPHSPNTRPADHPSAHTAWPVNDPQVPTARPVDHARTGWHGSNAQDPTAHPQFPDHTQTGRQNSLQFPLARPGDHRPAHAAWQRTGAHTHTRPAERSVVPVPLRRAGAEPAHARHAAGPARRRTISSDMVLDTVPMGRVRHRRGDTGAVVYALPDASLDTPPSGLRKFDLGTVPASVTPPRSWRKAAWFAVGTSAAVVLGLAAATVEFMGHPADGPVIDALPAYPTGPLTLEKLPIDETTSLPGRPTTRPDTSRPNTVRHSDAPPTAQPSTADPGTTPPTGSPTAPGTGTGSTTPGTQTTPARPTRTTVGRAPVTPTNPQAMGDRTEAYFRAVTEDPAAANAMTSGGLAREGAKGIESRYAGVERVEVQQITIDRDQSVTTSTVKVIREDGSESIEQRRLTFTLGGDPKITEDSATA